jgi:hypothetical protein
LKKKNEENSHDFKLALFNKYQKHLDVRKNDSIQLLVSLDFIKLTSKKMSKQLFYFQTGREQTLQLSGPIRKLRRKFNVVNAAQVPLRL